MGPRKLFRLLFSAISAVFALILATNVDRLLAARGWDQFLTKGADTEVAGWLPAIVMSPWVVFLAIGVLSFTAGLWFDAALTRFDGRFHRKPKPLDNLGRDSIYLARSMRNAANSYFQDDASELMAQCYSLVLRYEKFGFPIPEIPQKFDLNERFRMLAQYFTMVGQLLVNHHEAQAREAAGHLSKTLPTQEFPHPRF